MIEIEFRHVGKSFVDRQSGTLRSAVSKLDIRIRSGEVVSIIGPSGSSKTQPPPPASRTRGGTQ